MAVVNMTEVLARQMWKDPELQKLLPCHCQQCLDDVLAMALNHLPPRYATTDEGQLYVQVEYLRPQLRSDILRELTQAALWVSSHPRHASAESDAAGGDSAPMESEGGSHT
ncbi:late competence development ComFB family protein [Alicyclobacillus mali]|uniref:Late competence development ComFB family protein n=1 Tax=Alicyclobacillus mali (ex Roth et al. 2021) TaxID=1123961 RepID=A0ABS0F3G3_9BACL|nr:late competence development ComFB family protein [Alicyclobacillus mali (ex Roth et al. 2021)]MBF8377812.1 late competence development ComFB family protein [Alicyclobacillus mali (ex Roth et al. 2021)]